MVLVDLGSILGEALLQDQGAVLIVGWMDTGLEIARLETGRISVIVVGNEATLKEIVRIVQRKQLNVGVVSHVHQVQGGVEVEAVATAGIIVTAVPAHP